MPAPSVFPTLTQGDKGRGHFVQLRCKTQLKLRHGCVQEGTQGQPVSRILSADWPQSEIDCSIKILSPEEGAGLATDW